LPEIKKFYLWKSKKNLMKKHLLVILVILFSGYSLQLMAQAKKFVLIEHFTQASCGPCAQQNPYLQAVLDATRGTTHHIAYHTSWPGVDPMNAYNPTEVAARVSYYGVNAVPDCFVLGNLYHGGPAGITTDIINDATVEAAPVRVKVSETSNGVSRTVTVKIFSFDTLPAATYKLRVAVVEKLVQYSTPPGSNGEKNFPDVFRKMLPNTGGDTYTPAAVGDSVTFTYNYTLDLANWDTTQIYTIAFIQKESNKEIINSGSSIAPGWELFGTDPCFARGTPGDVKTFHYKLVNLKSTVGNFRIKLNPNMPDGWSGDFELNSNTYSDSVDVQIPANSTLDLALNITVGTMAGISNSILSMQTLDNTDFDPQTVYADVISGVYELIVNNDGSWGSGTTTTAADYQQNYIDGLNYAGSTYFDVIRMGALLKAYKYDCLSDIMNYYFNVSWTFPSLTNDKVALFSSEMDAGKNLFISGQDIGWDTWDISNGGNGTAITQAFYTNYMNAHYDADGGSTDNKLIANTSDSVFGSIPTSNVVNVYGGSYFYPDEINAIGIGTDIFYYNTAQSKKAGVRATNGTWKMVYLVPSLEMVQDSSVRKEIIKVTHDWFGGPNLSVRQHNGFSQDMLGQNFPNPAGGKTTVLLNGIDRNMTVEVLDITGRTQQVIPLEKGASAVTLDATSLSSGLYIYRLVSGKTVVAVQKMQVVH
jgi:hypothetical protein